MGYDEIAGNLSGRHTEETPGLPARAFFTAQRLGKPNMSWTNTITKENQEKQHEPFKPQNTHTTTGGGFSNTLPHCFQFSSSKIREIFQRIVGWPYLNLLNWMLPGGVSTICLRQKDQLRIFSSFTARLRSLGRGGGRWQWWVFGWFFDLSCGSLNMESPRNTVKFVWNREKHQKKKHVFFTVALLDTFGLDEVCGQLEMIEKKKGARIDASISFAIKKGG